MNLTLQLDAEGCLEPQFHWVSTACQALAALRKETFDCVLIGDDPQAPTGAAAPVEPLPLLRGLCTGGFDDPVVLLASRLSDEQWAEACRYDCEVLVTPNLWESPALVPVIKRAIQRVELSRENHRLGVANHRRLVRERDEAEHLLNQQRQIVQELESLTGAATNDTAEEATILQNQSTDPGSPSRPARRLPAEVNDYYHELLRTYVIMGSGSLGTEIARLAELVAGAGLSTREALQLHLERVETLVRGLGSRSTRHVMARADLLALELMIHLGECYQQRSSPAQHERSP